VLSPKSDEEAAPSPDSEDAGDSINKDLILSKIPDNLMWWLSRMHTPLYAIRRDYRDFSGVLVGVEVEIKTIMLVVEEKKTDYEDGMIVKETKCMRIPLSGLSDVQFVLEREETSMEEDENYG
jgi:hypothetical protein|tara:strand:- start:84 stop:452 length:369 start_codon:yes stop_codon:yes gene_type:complete